MSDRVPWSSLTEEGKLERSRGSGGPSVERCAYDHAPLRTTAEKVRGSCNRCEEMLSRQD